MSFGGQAPSGPAKELKRSPRFLSRGREKMWKKEKEEGRKHP